MPSIFRHPRRAAAPARALAAALTFAAACGDDEPTAAESAERRALAELRTATTRFQQYAAAEPAGYAHLFLDACMVALHVWLWKDNPSGLYADWNPAVSCQHAASVAAGRHH